MQIRAELLFVYGTLKDPGLCAAVLQDAGGTRRVGRGTIQGRLYDAGSYPAFVPSDDPADRVAGVLLELDAGAAALERLDAYEGVADGLYERRRVTVRLHDTTRDAWVYVYCRPLAGLPRIARW